MKIGYLICTRCGSYYEIKPQDHPDEFSDKCECGGNIKFVRYDAFHDDKRKFRSGSRQMEKKKDHGELFVNLLVGGIFLLFGLLGFFMVYSDWSYWVYDYMVGDILWIFVVMLSLAFFIIGLYGICGGFTPKRR